MVLLSTTHAFVADKQPLDGPEGLTGGYGPQIGLYAHPCQDIRTLKMDFGIFPFHALG
jgi:hypothetical protein